MTRRNFLAKAGVTGLAGFLAQSATAEEPNTEQNSTKTSEQTNPNQQFPPGEPGRDYTPVITPDGTALPYKVIDGVKIFHLVAEEVDHEFAPGLRAQCWGFNGRVHGPTIEAVEGDKVRIYVT